MFLLEVELELLGEVGMKAMLFYYLEELAHCDVLFLLFGGFAW